MSTITISKDRTIYYEMVAGSKNSPYLIFLHEGLGCTQMFRDFPELVCRKTGCPGIVYDRTGYGKSSPLKEKRSIHYLHEYALDELPEVIERVIPGKPFILIGHSDGGSISLIFSAKRSENLKAIISEAAHVFVDDMTIDAIQKARDAYRDGKLSALFRYHGNRADAVFDAWASTWLSDWFPHWNIEYLLPSITVPVLVIQGKDDQYGTAEQATSISSRTSGQSELFMPEGCGHSPHHDAAELVSQTMADFILKVSETS